MKLKKFKNTNKKGIGVLLFTILCVLLVCGAVFFRTFAIFEVKTNQNVINGSVQDPGNIYFAFYVDDKIQKDLPSKDENYVFNSQKSYCGVLGEKDDFIKLWWNRDDGSVIVSGMQTSRTKCNLYFEKGENLIDKINNLPVAESGDGLYIVTHEDATIDYTEDNEKQKLLQQEERRYAGKNPNNYVWFNNELWRIIGLVNTPEGSRIKLIRNERIGNYSWDSSEEEINGGQGINEWSQADLNFILNDYYYNSLGNQNCYVGMKNEVVRCDFNNTGLKYSHGFIDSITWNLGSNDLTTYLYNTVNVQNAYNFERSKNTGNLCTQQTCTDTISRNIFWKGKVGLMYPSDFGYATSGGTLGRNQCFNTAMFNWKNADFAECVKNDWLNISTSARVWTITPRGANHVNWDVFLVDPAGYIYVFATYSPYAVFPVVYLKEDVLVSSLTNGSIDSPYIIG